MKREIIDIGIPKDKSDCDGYLLVKFFEKEEYQQDFLQGKLFFNTVDYFAWCDQNGRCDRDEGMTFIIDNDNPNYVAANLEKVGNSYAIVVRDYSDHPENYQRGTVVNYSTSINRNRKLISFCTLYVNIERQEIYPINSKMKNEFGKYGVLITDRRVLFDRIYKKLKSEQEYSHIGLGFVEYLPKEAQKGLLDWHPFKKRADFSYQNEFRVTFTSNTEQPVKLDLGCSLLDIVAPIYATDLDDIHFDDGKLLYPLRG